MPSKTKGLKFLVCALGSRNFRLFFFGQAISLIGTWMQIIAMRWLVYRLTKSELMLGMVGFISDITARHINSILEDGDQEELMLALRRMSEAFGGVQKLAGKAS